MNNSQAAASFSDRKMSSDFGLQRLLLGRIMINFLMLQNQRSLWYFMEFSQYLIFFLHSKKVNNDLTVYLALLTCDVFSS